MAEIDLTGVWQGLYSYMALSDHVGFTATVVDRSGRLSGTTNESDPNVLGAPRDADISGRRSGASVQFTKTYAGDAFAPIDYDGHLNGDASEIEGTWTIRGASSGRFLMIRGERTAEEMRARKVEPVR